MTLSFKNGCLIEAAKNKEIDYLIHGCNCFSTQGAGVAKLIKENFPKAFLVDQADYRSPIERIGSYSSVFLSGLTIINLYCQYDYGTDYRRFEYGAFKRALDEICRDFSFTGKTIGLPEIGCGLGKADKGLVHQILEDYATEGSWTIYSLGK
jgi:O-acetyl-ADP-ribose deacetylase (regulator of RNase III)